MQLLVAPSRHWEEPTVSEVGDIEVLVEGHVRPVPEEAREVNIRQVFDYWLSSKRSEMHAMRDNGSIENLNLSITYLDDSKAEIQYEGVIPAIGKRVQVTQQVKLLEDSDGCNRDGEGHQQSSQEGDEEPS